MLARWQPASLVVDVLLPVFLALTKLQREHHLPESVDATAHNYLAPRLVVWGEKTGYSPTDQADGSVEWWAGLFGMDTQTSWRRLVDSIGSTCFDNLIFLSSHWAAEAVSTEVIEWHGVHRGLRALSSRLTTQYPAPAHRADTPSQAVLAMRPELANQAEIKAYLSAARCDDDADEPLRCGAQLKVVDVDSGKMKMGEVVLLVRNSAILMTRLHDNLMLSSIFMAQRTVVISLVSSNSRPLAAVCDLHTQLVLLSGHVMVRSAIGATDSESSSIESESLPLASIVELMSAALRVLGQNVEDKIIDIGLRINSPE